METDKKICRFLDVTAFSCNYSIRFLTEDDIDIIMSMCKGNPQYYRYSEKELNTRNIKADIHVTPPGVGIERKYAVGYFNNNKLAAILDLIDGYPEKEYAFIGFFMLSKDIQGKGKGSSIIGELMNYLKAAGYKICRLGIDSDNPQSNHFWDKNGFRIVNKVGRILVADKYL